MTNLTFATCAAGILVLAGMTPRDGLAQSGNNSPKLFAPGVVSGPADDLSPAFTPDGNTVIFTRGNNSGSVLMVSNRVGGKWSAPVVASFSGPWNDLEPAMAPDGSFLIFASNRPVTDGGKAIDGKFNGKVFPEQGGNLWRVARHGNTWGTPTRLPETINAGTGTFSPSVSSDGSIYFMRPDDNTGRFHLYRSQYRAGTYQAAQRVPLGSDSTEDVDPAVAPDESFIVYSSNHPDRHDP
ncbi:MAG: TolB family protein, partial [Gemmatimonadaceae bacterium]